MEKFKIFFNDVYNTDKSDCFHYFNSIIEETTIITVNAESYIQAILIAFYQRKCSNLPQNCYKVEFSNKSFIEFSEDIELSINNIKFINGGRYDFEELAQMITSL